MAKHGGRRISPLAIILGVAALFVLPLLVFLGQIGMMVAVGILVVVLVGAALFSRMKTPSD
jgi:uncharacterized membrane protein